MPLILPGNVATATASTAYDIANSCRFNKADTPGLSRSTGDGNEKIGSFSFWWKTADPHDGSIFYQVRIDSSNFFNIGMDGGGNIEVTNKDGGSYNLQCETTAIYRDHSAWYHVCAIIDTTQAVAANRMKLYINGIQVTSFQTETYPDQNTDLKMNPDSQTAYISHSGNRMHGYLAEFVVIDGTAQAVTDFGEFNSDSPAIWQPIDVSGLTKGTNGFYLDFEDSSNLGNCAFGGTDLTEANLAATDQATDTPTNNFCTINPLYQSGTGGQLTVTEGNTTYIPASSGHCYSRSSMGFSSGNWYLEAKITEVSAGESAGIGVVDTELANTSDPQAATVQGGFQVQFSSSNTNLNENAGGGGQTLITNSFASGDIVQMAVDADDGKIWLGHNGTWYNDDNASTTFSAANHDMTYTTGSLMQFYFQAYESSGNYDTTNMNFGCPTFAISSSNSDANGYGNFEFPVPSGFYALCTKNLAEFG